MKIPKARKLPSGLWFIQLRLGGQSVPVSARTEKECIRQAQLVKAEYIAGNRAASGKSSLTLTQAIDNYIKTRSNVLSPSTIRGYRIIQRNRFKGLMDRVVNEIREQDWKEAYNKEAGLCSAKTLHNAWALLKSVLQDQKLPPLPSVNEKQIVPNERAFLTHDDIRKFVAAADGDPYQIPALLALSSLRCSEICALRWENVDLENGLVYVQGAVVPDEHHKYVEKKENKNRTSARVVPILIPELTAALAAAKQSSGPVVRYKSFSILRGVKRICAKADVPDVTTHGLRHSFASLAYHLKVPEQITMEMGGWSDPGTMRKIYTHISKSDVSHYGKEIAGFYAKPEENANENANKNSEALRIQDL